MFKPALPTKDGYYWHRFSHEDDRPLICQVEMDDGEAYVRFFGDDDWDLCLDVGGEWDGPLEYKGE